MDQLLTFPITAKAIANPQELLTSVDQRLHRLLRLHFPAPKPNLAIFPPKAEWADHIVDLARQYADLSDDDAERMVRCIESHQALVVMPRDRIHDLNAILGAIFRENVNCDEHSPTGGRSGQTVMVARIFGLFLLDPVKQISLAPTLIASAAALSAVETGTLRQVFASAPELNLPVRESLKNAKFWIQHPESAFVALRHIPRHYGMFVTRRTTDKKQTILVAILEEESAMACCSIFSTLTEDGVVLPTGDRVQFIWPTAEYNADVDLAARFGRGDPAAMITLGLRRGA